MRRVVLEAIGGDIQAAKLLLQYIDGDPKQTIDIKSETIETKINIYIQAKIEADPEAKKELEIFANRITGILNGNGNSTA